MNSTAVLGAGSWGTALAILLAEKGVETTLWARKEETARKIRDAGENPLYLPGFPLPPDLEVTPELERALSGKEVVLLAVPSHGMRQTARLISDMIGAGILERPPRVYVSAAKGIENETFMTMTEVLSEVLPREPSHELAVLSGPSFAKEVALKMPTAVTIAAFSEETARMLTELFSTDFFRVYSTLDVTGVQLGGAVKNVMAVAAGISDGLGFGTNTRAALITRGLAEMSRLGLKLGANPLTFAGLAGLGDLVLTCTGDLSRNRQVGLKLGKGQTMEEIRSSMNQVAEGIRTSKSLYRLSRRHNVEMPITAEVYKVVHKGLDPRKAVRSLLDRPPKPELHGVI